MISRGKRYVTRATITLLFTAPMASTARATTITFLSFADRDTTIVDGFVVEAPGPKVTLRREDDGLFQLLSFDAVELTDYVPGDEPRSIRVKGKLASDGGGSVDYVALLDGFSAGARSADDFQTFLPGSFIGLRTVTFFQMNPTTDDFAHFGRVDHIILESNSAGSGSSSSGDLTPLATAIPNPEPASLFLLSAGLLGLAVRSYRPRM